MGRGGERSGKRLLAESRSSRKVLDVEDARGGGGGPAIYIRLKDAD